MSGLTTTGPDVAALTPTPRASQPVTENKTEATLPTPTLETPAKSYSIIDVHECFRCPTVEEVDLLQRTYNFTIGEKDWKKSFKKGCIKCMPIHKKEKGRVRPNREFCNRPLDLIRRCTRCYTASYCNSTCQGNDWKSQKDYCKHASKPENKAELARYNQRAQSFDTLVDTDDEGNNTSSSSHALTTVAQQRSPAPDLLDSGANRYVFGYSTATITDRKEARVTSLKNISGQPRRIRQQATVKPLWIGGTGRVYSPTINNALINDSLDFSLLPVSDFDTYIRRSCFTMGKHSYYDNPYGWKRASIPPNSGGEGCMMTPPFSLFGARANSAFLDQERSPRRRPARQA
eukprot:g11854.t1